MLTVLQERVEQPLTDVERWDVFFAPDDDIHGVLMTELQAAAAGTEVHSSQYGFTDLDVARQFAILGQASASSRFLFDRTQAAGHYEEPILKAFVAQLQPAQWAIGTSSRNGQILHTKAVALLFADGSGWTMTGSFNLSQSAESQFNIVDVVRSRSRAELFAARIDAMFDWVRSHEPNGGQP